MDLFITAFVTLFLVIDPIGLSPMFIALTQGMENKQRRIIAMRASLIGLFILIVFALAGDKLLSFIGIGFPAFRIAGGILLFLTAVEMLFSKRSSRREKNAEQDDSNDPSVFPLATPLIAGPGAITTIILLVTNGNNSWGDSFIVIAAMTTNISILFFFFFFSNVLERLLGKTGINVITRLLGMLLAALAIQFIIDGLKNLGMFS